MQNRELIGEALGLSPNAIAYEVSRQLADRYPDNAIVQGNTGSFDLEEYAQAGLCRATLLPDIHNQIITEWNGTGHGLSEAAKNAWYEIYWQGRALDVLLMTWHDGDCETRTFWILSEVKETAETFLLSVCEWNAEVRGEVLVFQEGYWCKSEELFQAIKSATFDNLILAGELKQDLQDGFAQFFESREVYERYGIPWKRGVLLIGAPGNGKTHTVKALINHLNRPCLYVKSFKSRYGNDHANIRQVFARARQTTPCLLVLEDLDSLIDAKNRAFFLNELDGFASNTGIVVLATTNHPERLDPAILERPSRFDRKYLFALPDPDERLAYLVRWNEEVEPDLRLSDAGLSQVVDQTEGYSFAYLKELWLASLMCWVAEPQPGSMDGIMTAQAVALREQMRAAVDEPTPTFVTDDED